MRRARSGIREQRSRWCLQRAAIPTRYAKVTSMSGWSGSIGKGCNFAGSSAIEQRRASGSGVCLTNALVTPWDFPAPHVVTLEVLPADIDAYDHVNNSVYLAWFDRAAWSHSATLGISIEQCVKTLRRGMAAHRTEIDFLRAAVLGDRVLVGTWITETDSKLRVQRRFQVRRTTKNKTHTQTHTEYVCINLDSGRAARMPDVFKRAYAVTETIPRNS